MTSSICMIGIHGERSYPPHIHEQYELIYYLEGSGSLHTSMGDLPFSAGSIMVVPPGILHGSVSQNGFRLIAISGDFGNRFRFSKPLSLRDNESRDTETLCRIIYRNRFNNGDYLNALMEACVHFVLQNSAPESPITAAVTRIVNVLSEHFYEPELSPVTYLNQSGYAEDYIRAHFKKITGKTPHEFLTSIRIHHARQMIGIYQDVFSLSEIATQCGFTDYVYFSKKFKECTGCSPKTYKAQMKKGL